MKMNRHVVAAFGAVTIAAVLAACAEAPTSPASRTAFVPKSSFAVGDAQDFAIPVATELVICKAGDVNGNFTITYDPAAAPGPEHGGIGGTGNPDVATPLDVAVGECRLAAVDEGDASEEQGDFFTVTETPQAGVTSSLVCYLNDGNTDPDTCPSTFFVNTAHGWTLVYTNTQEETGEGCTPGYWKQDQHLDSWTTYTPGQSLEAVVGANLWPGSPTFAQALDMNGGGLAALARHGAAALLNAASADVDYEYTTDEVKAIIAGTGAYSTLSVEERKDLLAAANEAGCPLN